VSSWSSFLLSALGLSRAVSLPRSKSTPDPFPTPSSQALSELTLAHRRLSSKLDHTQNAFEASQKVVAVKEAEAATWKRERDAMGVLLQEWRDRVIQTEREREEERTRRIGVEEELRILRGGFPESQLGVSGGGLAVQPADQPDGQHATLAEDTAPEPASDVSVQQPVSLSPTGSPAHSHSPAELRGLKRLTADFTTSLGACHEKIAHLETLADELKASKDIAVQEADEARSLYAKVQGEIEVIRAEDFGAGKVVERYM
jgi:chromosome segregation ATPase